MIFQEATVGFEGELEENGGGMSDQGDKAENFLKETKFYEFEAEMKS